MLEQRHTDRHKPEQKQPGGYVRHLPRSIPRNQRHRDGHRHLQQPRLDRGGTESHQMPH